MSVGSARRHLERLAQAPRPAGSANEASARQYCSDVLRGLGFDVVEMPFDYSSAPGRWATPLGGAASIGVLAAAGHVGSRGQWGVALALLAATLAVGAPAALWTARRGVLSFPFSRRTAVNLVATRGTTSPAVWLVAHLDSKSQPVPTAARAFGIVASVAVWIVALVTAVAQSRGFPVESWWYAISLAGLIAGIPVAASVVGARSPGALDNASGVATVLGAAERLNGAPVGVLLTSAEELGLAGARAWAAANPVGLALNCDGIDDVGTLVCMRSGDFGRSRAAAAYRDGAGRCGLALQVRGLIPGLLVDAVALADAGWDAATLSRGRWATLARVHRPSDDLAHLAGAGIEEAACVMAAAAVSVR